MVIIWGIEYTTGLMLRVFVGSEPWFYTGPFAVDGLVRLDYGAAWFVAGLLFEKVHTTLDYYESILGKK